MEHLDALNLRLSNERIRLANAKTEGERNLRKSWVAGIEKEIAGELQFLGITETDISDEDLLAQLSA